MARLVLVRHTRPAVDAGVCYGRLDLALATTAQADQEACLADIPPATRIFSSPLTRCRVLAEAVGRRDGRTVVLDDRLMEIDFGRWEGARWDVLPREDITAWANDPLDYAPGGGESLVDVWTRLESFWQDLHWDSDETVVVVTHHGPIRALAAQLQRREKENFFDLTVHYGEIWSWELDIARNAD